MITLQIAPGFIEIPPLKLFYKTKNRSYNLVDKILKMVYFELKYYSNSQHSSTALNGFNNKRAFSLQKASFIPLVSTPLLSTT